jgi:uncharacterized protein
MKSNGFVQFLLHYRWWLLSVLLALLFLGGKSLQSALQVNNSLEIWFDDHDPELSNYQLFQQQFGSDEVVVVLLQAPEGILSPQRLAAFKDLHKALQALPAVQQVVSAADFDFLELTALGLRPRPLLQGDSSQIVARLNRMPALSAQFFNADRQAVRLLVQLAADPHMDEKRGILIQQIKTTAQAHWPTQELSFGGVGVIFAALNALTQEQFGLFVGLAYLLMLALLGWLFRSWRVLVITFGAMLLATLLSLSIYGALGHQLNLMTVLIPILILLLCTMDVIHLLFAWYQANGNGRERLVTAFQQVWKPCVFTTLTTMAGFLALLSSPMDILQQFGLYSALGIGLSLPITWLLAAFLLPAYVPKHPARQIHLPQSIFQHLVKRPKLAWSLVFILLVWFGWGISRLQSDTYTLGYLPTTNEAVQHHQAISQHWGPYMPLELWVKSNTGASLTDSSQLQALQNWQQEVQAAGFGEVFGFHSLYEAAASGGDTTVVLTQAALQRGHKLLQKHYPALLATYYQPDAQLGRITIFGEMRSAKTLGNDLQVLQNISTKVLGEALSLQPAGYLPLYAKLVPNVIQSQISSLLGAAVVIGLLLWLFLQHVQTAAIALFTNAFPLLAMYGIMGWLGIEVDIATASIGAIGLSFCVDDAVHIAAGYRKHRQARLLPEQAMLKTYHSTGNAIFFSSMVLFVGFASMGFSSLKTVYLFGLLSCWMIFWALFAQLVLFPMLIARFDNEPYDARKRQSV